MINKNNNENYNNNDKPWHGRGRLNSISPREYQCVKPRYYKGGSSFNMSEVKNALDDIRKVNVLKRQKFTLLVNIVGVKGLCIEIEKLED